MIQNVLVAALIGYLLGSLAPAYWLFRWRGIDPYTAEGSSKNLGATNVWRLLGWKSGLLVFLVDTAKGLLSVVAALQLHLGFWAALAAGCMALLGHCFSPWIIKANGRRCGGGKGVATALGVVLALAPVVGGIGFLIFAIVFLLTRIISVGSAAAAVGVLVYLLFRPQSAPVTIIVTVAVLLVLVRHRDNFQRLATGEELGKRWMKLPQLGAWPRWMVPRYWWAALQMKIWKPDAHVVFTIHWIGEGDAAAARSLCVRFPWLIPFYRILPGWFLKHVLRYTPYWVSYLGMTRVEVEDAGRKRIICIHTMGIPWNTVELTDETSPVYPVVVDDFDRRLVYAIRQFAPEAISVTLGAGTAFLHQHGTGVHKVLAAAGYPDIIVSNGNTFTGSAAVTNFLWYHRQWTEAAPNRHGKRWNIAIIGAAGSVGSGFARLVANLPQYCAEVKLVGSKPDDPKVVALANELNQHSKVRFIPATREEVLATADVVVLATNQARTLDFTGLREAGTFILDIAKPANVPRDVCRDPRHLAVAGSIVTLPGRGRGSGFSIGMRGYLGYGCQAEGVINAMAQLDPDRWQYLIGSDVKASRISTLFTGKPRADVGERMGVLAEDFGIRACDTWLDPHTGLPINRERVRAFLAADHWSAV